MQTVQHLYIHPHLEYAVAMTRNHQLLAVQTFVLKRAPNIGMLIKIHCSSLATFLVGPAEVTA